MPRNVRNFWITGNVDGRKERLGFGPRSKDGGFSIEIKMRDEGSVGDSTINVWGRVVETPDGEYLKLTIDDDHEEVFVKMTRRQARGKRD